MAEIEIAILQGHAPSRRLPDEAALRRQVSAVETERNTHTCGIAWQFTSCDARRQAGAAPSGESMLIGLITRNLHWLIFAIYDHQTLPKAIILYMRNEKRHSCAEEKDVGTRWEG